MGMNPRFRAIEQIRNRPTKEVLEDQGRLRDYFREHVFDDKVMRHYLSQEVYANLIEAIDHGKRIKRATASPVAHAMKAWAIEKGATHFTHWFQPLSGMAAEKHDSFIDFQAGEAIEKFSADELVQQEPDASSLATGGIRSTFEARGLTAWDCSSPAFIFETRYGKTLCIPTIFVSYTGESLDFKIPLLKSIALLDVAAVALAQLFDKSIQRVIPTLGTEQEYFLVDSRLFDLRPDLMLAGRTVLGAPSARDFQVGNRYFGSISERAVAFLNELEIEALKLGIPLKTRHNEVAPGQFELALQYEELNVAVDHGQLLMDLIERTAQRHQLRALLHEKPFAGINGSAKHNNWSIHTSKGKNLLSPGGNPKENLMFLAFFTSVIRAVAEHSDLLAASVASAGNDLRLGAEEAPSLIISVFLGSLLTQILDDIETPPRKSRKQLKNPYLKLGISKIPELLLDNTDRNRTAPFAFTGNKFEFRAVGASANSSHPMMVLNVIVAEQLTRFLDQVTRKMARSRKKELAVLDIIRENIIASKSVRFEGDGSSQAWRDEAEKRGLLRDGKTPHALDAYLLPKTVKLFTESAVFTESEIHSRHAVLIRNYVEQSRTESGLLLELAMSGVVPCGVAYLAKLKQAGLDTMNSEIPGIHTVLSGHLTGVWQAIDELKAKMKEVEMKSDIRETALAYSDQVFPLCEAIRKHCDVIESLVPDEDWPYPKYRELLFIR